MMPDIEDDIIKGPRMLTIVMLLPSGGLKNWLLRRLGHQVHLTSTIRPVLVISVVKLVFDEGSSIGFGNVVYGLDHLELKRHARIGQWNWISAARPLRSIGAPCRLVLGLGTVVTSRHYLDCSGGVEVGDATIVAGVRSTFISHGIDVLTSMQTVAPIVIASDCLISSNVQFVPGAFLPRGTLVAMGSVVVREHWSTEGPQLLAGVPATRRRLVSGKFFGRSEAEWPK